MTETVVYFRTTSRSDFVFYADRLVSQGFFLCSQGPYRERKGSVVECLTRDRNTAGSSLTGVAALWS